MVHQWQQLQWWVAPAALCQQCIMLLFCWVHPSWILLLGQWYKQRLKLAADNKSARHRLKLGRLRPLGKKHSKNKQKIY